MLVVVSVGTIYLYSGSSFCGDKYYEYVLIPRMLPGPLLIIFCHGTSQVTQTKGCIYIDLDSDQRDFQGRPPIHFLLLILANVATTPPI